MNFDSQMLLGIYSLAMGHGTEAGSNPYQLTVTRDRSGKPIGASGYPIGVIQIDFGQQRQNASSFVKMVESWAEANGMAGFSSIAGVTAASQSNGRTPNTGLVALSASDQSLIDQWAAVPTNQATFFQTFEATYANGIVSGDNGVDAFTEAKAFQKPTHQWVCRTYLLPQSIDRDWSLLVCHIPSPKNRFRAASANRSS